MAYQYDLAGNRTRLTWPEGYFVDYEYDSLNRIIRVRENGTIDLATYSYDALSRQITVTFGNGTTTTLGWQPTDDDLDSVTQRNRTTAKR